MANDEKPLYVRMDEQGRKSLLQETLDIGGDIGRRVPLTEYVREAIEWGKENRAAMTRRLKKRLLDK